jgi:hypothetical protein
MGKGKGLMQICLASPRGSREGDGPKKSKQMAKSASEQASSRAHADQSPRQGVALEARGEGEGA